MIFLKKKKKKKKNTWKYDIFFKCREKLVFPKKIALEYDLSCIIWKSGAFSPENMIYFFGRKMKDDLSQERHRKWYFLYYMYKYYKYDITLLQKEPEMIFYKKKTTKKKHLKVIDILDDIVERVPTIFCTFMGTFIDVFIYCFPVKQNQET